MRRRITFNRRRFPFLFVFVLFKSIQKVSTVLRGGVFGSCSAIMTTTSNGRQAAFAPSAYLEEYLVSNFPSKFSFMWTQSSLRVLPMYSFLQEIRYICLNSISFLLCHLGKSRNLLFYEDGHTGLLIVCEQHSGDLIPSRDLKNKLSYLGRFLADI